ncbi:MAG: helix-hairpin-helix domain-containing protein [Epsilonproteobacteria bacterium]|nr:MAG: helix-hairpin-helix domain-containing protein [Campylobacterota bacterium]
MKILTIVALSVSLLFGAVDINTASKSELMSLNGVGEKKADSIIKYRKGNCFKSVDGLAKVKGIGNKFMAKNRKNLKAGKCKK